MANENGIPEPSPQEIQMANDVGLKPQRLYGQSEYSLVAVADKGDGQQVAEIESKRAYLKQQQMPCKLEEKTSVLALYMRVA